MAGPMVATQGTLTLGGTTLLDIRNIEFVRRARNVEYASSSTAGGVRRKKGHVDFDGSFEFYPQDGEWDSSSPTLEEGETYAVVFTSADGTNTNTKSGNVIINELTIRVPIEADEAVSGVATFARVDGDLA